MQKVTLYGAWVILLYAVHAFAATVEGTVVDTADRPIAGATVSLVSIQTQTTTTNNAGAFRFNNVQTGTYIIYASRQGYQQSAGEVLRITSADTTVTVKIVLTSTGFTPPQGRRGQINVTVTDESTDSAIVGAKVVLLAVQMQGGQLTFAPIDSGLTNASGRITFDSLAVGQYQVVVSAAGYNPETQQTSLMTDIQTRNLTFALARQQVGSIVGRVTSDSVTGPALEGAMVILSSRGLGGQTTPLDTTITDRNGEYSFTNVTARGNYVLTASKAGYETRSVRHDNQSTGIDTVSIVLTKQATGSLAVWAAKRSDSTAIGGAQVVLTLQGTTTPAAMGTTNAQGWATFSDLPTGTYSITVSGEGYASQTVSNTVNRNDRDTVRVYLVVAAGGTKVFRGTVIDSASGAPVTNALVVLRITVPSLTLVDSSDAQGNYAIGGIPVTVLQGTLTATAVGYRDFSRQVTIGQPGESDTTTYTIRMVAVPTHVARVQAGPSAAAPTIVLAGTVLSIYGFEGKTDVAFYSPAGRCLHRSVFSGGTYAIPLKDITPSPGRYLVRVSNGNVSLVKQVMAPKER